MCDGKVVVSCDLVSCRLVRCSFCTLSWFTVARSGLDVQNSGVPSKRFSTLPKNESCTSGLFPSDPERSIR